MQSLLVLYMVNGLLHPGHIERRYGSTQRAGPRGNRRDSIAARTDHDASRARVNRRLDSVLLGLETLREEIRCDLSAVEIGSNSC